ncbi:MAG: type III-B CRISPR-associated protein Cas10/Cmr2 [Deltaproteobacteria bacterium]|nr:type III-B CRISPR-associated protein Cas10/Cmr2 [Deltaproteobacteria bacterium]
MKHLLVFALGPVQDFIATARRCQDLWFGSWLLSDLARHAALAIQASAGSAEPLVVPGDLATDDGVANEVIAVVDADPTTVADRARSAVTRRLEHHMADFFRDLHSVQNGGFFHRDVAEAQVRDLVETIWAAVPMTEGYARARDRAKAVLATRKATRTWSQASHEGPVPKSSLDGSRASVIDEQAYDALKAGTHSIAAFRRTYKAKRAERLSGVDLLKRIGQERDLGGERDGRPIFHSTSHIASGPLRARLARHAAGAEAFRRWREELERDGVDLDRFTIAAGEQAMAGAVPRVLPDGRGRAWLGLDGYLLYEDRIPEILSEYRAGEGDISLLEGQRRAGLHAMLGEVGLRRAPTAYYAVLLADGDRMGKYISEACTTEATHRRLSTRLAAWSRSVRATVEEHLGSCVYAGGDDVLALLPLHTALACARELAASFRAEMEGTDRLIRDAGARGDVPTLSVGVGISHHMQPMRDALDLARAAEKQAKTSGRNALAVMVDKRSGGRLVAVDSWDRGLDERIARWGELFGREALPDKIAFALEQAMDTVRPTTRDVPTTGVVRALVERALSRRRSERGSSEVDGALRSELASRLAFDQDDGARDAGLIERVRALSAELQIARLFLDAHDEANPA